MDLSLPLALVVALSGAVAGGMGALLGIGGGVFLVPVLVVGLQLPFTVAAGISLTTVIATSTSVAADAAGRQLINLRLGVLLEVATAVGGLLGGVTAQMLPAIVLQRLFSLVSAVIGVLTLARASRRNILDASVDPGRWGGRLFDEDTGRVVAYRLKRLPLAMFGSFLAGNVSTLLGIGGGTIKVPLLTTWCGIPIRVAAATSAFMIGVTATSGAVIYYGEGAILPGFAAAAVLGVKAGSWLGLKFRGRLAAHRLRTLLAVVLILVSLSMAWGTM
jgi:uncharacterized membrane protein YfcA